MTQPVPSAKVAMPGATPWLPWLRPVQDWDLAPLKAAAGDDGHVVIAPTHVIWKEGELAGYVSLGRMPLLLSWLHTHKIKARDTQYVLNLCENLASAAAPGGVLCVPCVEQSPLRPYMEKFGYGISAERVALCFKRL